MSLDEIDLTDGRNFVAGVPYHWFAELRREAPAYWHHEDAAPRGGFWAVTRYDDCVHVNRDWEHFSSARRTSLFPEMDDDQLAQQQLMMVNMDPTMHTRYRRLVNKGFTPKMVRDLEQQIVGYADGIVDSVCERGTADFVEEISAELPLLVIAELLGVPQEDRRMVFDWSNRMIGSEDPEYQIPDTDPGDAAMQVYAYAEELASNRRLEPREDLISVLLNAEVEGEKLNQLELDLFFMLLAVAGNETTRNLMSGAMVAFSQFPEQWERVRNDRALLPSAVEEMLRFVTPVMNFRRQATEDVEIGGKQIKEGDKVVFFHISANRDEAVFDDPDRFDVGRKPNPHMAFGGGGPHFCLGANLARMEIIVMFEHLLDRLPDLRVDGTVERLQSNFINGVKHLPVAFSPSEPVGVR
jgi:cholest-4-en-3-one 26-monooxygenase